ncbi:tetratricopeptide repeat protein [Pseudobacteriovorax antillogorgiicola]|uniref:Tetratricopeptide repeat-containing protein n=1 Tax=Pseudobacteriovorax antillogorgiicola TaxID=1513793 RepID=A0A1Y6CAZ0_9BACT|nr:tetratricopeptide repeat protein [Pseudobacteriovorax antillogorgiicola]TCS49468.1 tetratricopeptide repeat protein [Pseudobacteriovorax antillogorgiicola]SMF46275.1 Tetratricopeptide repeat-containing protein [Pseudobacteriovorax antillogorgiicola]
MFGYKAQLLVVVFALVGCVTPQEERQIKEDIARLQAQLVQMQNDFQDSDSSLKSSTNKRAASTNSRLERMTIDIQKLKGEVDALRVGVITGQLPGQTDDEGPSMATKLLAVIERLEALEEQQKKIMTAIEKAGSPSKKVESKRSSKVATNIKGLRRAFKEKRYRHVKEDAPAVIKKLKKGTKLRKEAQFLFAESLYKLGDIKSAALEFDEYLKSDPDNKVAHANLRLGDCFRHLGDSATAKIYYDELVSRYSSSEEARIAKQRLEKLSI